jgi:hypothetical protein
LFDGAGFEFQQLTDFFKTVVHDFRLYYLSVIKTNKKLCLKIEHRNQLLSVRVIIKPSIIFVLLIVCLNGTLLAQDQSIAF